MVIVRKTDGELFDAIREHWDCYFGATAFERAAEFVRGLTLTRHGDEISEVVEKLEERAAQLRERMAELNDESSPVG